MLRDFRLRYGLPVRQASSIAAFVADPVGAYVMLATCVTWCATPSLGGAACWGRPDVEDTRANLASFQGLWAPRMAERVDLVIDGTRMEGASAESIAALVRWMVEHRVELGAKVRLQLGVVPDGVLGLALAGISPTLQSIHAIRIHVDPREAMRVALPEDAARADDLHREIETLVAEARGPERERGQLARLVRRRCASLTLDQAAKELAVSSRSLQRALRAAGTTFQDELRRGRHEVACDLLASTDMKIGAIASRVGLSEQALTQLFREASGETPGTYRARLRSSGDPQPG